MDIGLISTPLLIIGFGVLCWFGNSQLHKRRVAGGADPSSVGMSCLLTAILCGGLGLFLLVLWINANWTG